MFKIYNNSTAKKMVAEFSNVRELLDYIQNPDRRDAKLIEELREGDSDAFLHRMRDKMEVCNFNYLNPVSNKNDSETLLSGYFYYVIEDSNDFDYDVTYIRAFWSTINGKGCCILVEVENIPNEGLEDAYKWVVDKVGVAEKDYLDTILMEAEPVSYDMQAHYNDDATALSFETKELEANLDLQPDFFPQLDGYNDIYYRTGGKIRLNNLDEVAENYQINFDENGLFDFGKEKIKYCQCFVPFEAVGAKNRYRFLSGFAKCLISLNPHMAFELLHHYLQSYSRRYFVTPLGDGVVEEIANNTYKLRGVLEPLENETKRFYFKDPKMPASEKKTLGNRILANDRAEKTRKELLGYLENWDYEKYPKITQVNLQKVSGRNRKTIENHYREVRNRFENK
ncbi:hypothetical protein HHL23_12505 [Chryseobacterium sp. RP-3-3]|uniref:Uncharacterized protein n=1 Tax=Chryseobacterium antibioticum TaxID=2728847 RepID=A0A7Y0FSF9_9FLAO|nr:hypothetical protein [Chryseobacterium antibioticum]NML70621.1 hypothetical protein [Chryseobacterium antibioticum]